MRTNPCAYSDLVILNKSHLADLHFRWIINSCESRVGKLFSVWQYINVVFLQVNKKNQPSISDLLSAGVYIKLTIDVSLFVRQIGLNSQYTERTLCVFYLTVVHTFSMCLNESR